MQQRSTLALNNIVKKGDTVGLVGRTGETATGPHLHFEIRIGTANQKNDNLADFYNRNTVNPASYDLSQLQSIDSSNQGGSTSTDSTNQQDNTTTDTTSASEDQPAIAPTCTPTACTEDELIIEIVGKLTDENQRILIYTEENQYDADRTQKRKKPEELQEGAYQSTLHTWDWKKAEKAHLWLEIQSTDKTPIRLPLLTGYEPITMANGEKITSTSDAKKAKLTARQTAIHGPLNLIAPFVPMTELLSYKGLTQKVDSHLKTTAPVLCCDGWVYIFKNNQLWREVQIRQDEKTGKTTYHDVRLADYRKESPHKIDAKADIRSPVGKPLDDIWLPARWNGITEEWQIFYAPSQLSEARLNYLQNNPNTLKQSSHHVLMHLYPLPYGSSLPAQQNNPPFLLTHGIDGVKTIPNHIPRDIGREYLLTDPSKYLANASYLAQVKQSSKVLHSFFASTTIAPDGTPNYLLDSVIRYEDISPAGWGYFLKQKMAKETKAALATEEEKKQADSAWSKYLRRKEDEDILWQPGNQQPILTPIINKKICGIYLFDLLNQLQHTHQLLGQCRELQSLVVDQATLRKNYGSAFLIKSIMLEIGALKESDVRYKAATRMLNNKKVTTRYDYAIAHKDRQFVKNLISLYQDYHQNLLKNDQTVEAIKDTTSGIGLDLLGGKVNLAQLLNDLNHPTTTDPLSTPSEIKKIVNVATIANTLTEPTNPYYNMLFPPKVDLESMLSPPKNQSLETVTAKGDGTWNPKALALLEPLTNDQLKIQVQLKETIGHASETLTVPQIEDLQK